MLKVNNIKFLVTKEVNPTYLDLCNYIKNTLINNYHASNVSNVKLIKKSLDARHGILNFILSATFNADNEESLIDNKNIFKYEENIDYLALKNLNKSINKKALVCGMGPSGLFNALILAKAGFKVTLIDRGSCVESRINDVDNFFNNGILNPESNIQYGEGGAGTFSDGKLTTNVNSPYIKYILEEFVSLGANSDILYESLPHVGTDVLRKVIVNLREKLISLGVKIYFNTKLVDFDSGVAVVEKDKAMQTLTYEYLVLAIGHSASDTFKMLKSKKISMSPKPFSMGVRIEHLQADINDSLYHGTYPCLGPASYKLVTHLDNGRSVYSFCMCPGGQVVNASTINGELVVNGMSNYARDGVNANSALLVGVNVEDYYRGDILDGIKFQRLYEQKAYNNGYANVQLVKDFLSDTKSTELGRIKPTIKPGYVLGEVRSSLPSFVVDSIKEALPIFDKKISGFACDDAILTAIESRSSSTITIERDENLCSSIRNVYAVGEGSGHAGGITTSALDGIKVALKIIEKEDR